MQKTAVVYKSKYGDSKQYAKWIAATLDADLFELDSNTVKKLAAYSTVIYGAGIYAGSIAGFSKFKEIFKRYGDKRFVLFTVMLTSVEKTEVFKNIIDRAFTNEMHAKVKPFHFRGGMDYSRLGFLHKVMMKMMFMVLSKKKPEDLTDDDKVLMASYGKTVSFLDEAAIEPLLSYVSSFDNTDS